jgi:GNAT superfamily N-acetyltransferase
LLAYFRLRHQVYTPMAYLPAAVEKVRSCLDIDWFDTRSVHIGAFEQHRGHRELIGTTRLITNEPLRPEHSEWTRELASHDPVLDRLVSDGAVQAMLPVFQSQELDDCLYRAYRDGFLVGELSRVIVHPKSRGAGLSRQLVSKAVELAEAYGVCELFLECLPIHETVYGHSGFSTLPLRGKVYMVNKTMIVMRRVLSPGPSCGWSFPGNPDPGRELTERRD